MVRIVPVEAPKARWGANHSPPGNPAASALVGTVVAPRRRRLLVPVVGLLIAACGNEEARGVEVGAPPAVGWSSEALGPPTADAEPLLLTDGDTAVVLTSAEGGGLEGWVSSDGGPFEPADTGQSTSGNVTAAAAGERGFLAMGSAYDDGFRPSVWRSEDGRAWEPVGRATGLDRPADVSTVLATDQGWVAVGSLRTGDDPAQRPFAAAAWRSTDGVSWTLVELAPGSEGSARSLASHENGLVAVGDVDGQPAVWRSVTADRWERIEVTLASGERDGCVGCTVERDHPDESACRAGPHRPSKVGTGTRGDERCSTSRGCGRATTA